MLAWNEHRIRQFSRATRPEEGFSGRWGGDALLGRGLSRFVVNQRLFNLVSVEKLLDVLIDAREL